MENMKTKYYYAGGSNHGSDTSFGFANDWTVYVFKTETGRDNWIENAHNLSARKIERKDITKYAANYSLTRNELIKPNPFSGRFWGVVEDNIGIGHIEVCDDGTYGIICRLSECN